MQKRRALLAVAVAVALLLPLAWFISARLDNRLSPALTAQSRIADKDIQLDAANTTARGAWSNGTTVWVTDYLGDKIYAYNLSNGDRDATRDFTSVNDPRNIWSDGTTMWVTDSSTTVRAYKLSDRTRAASKDIDARVCSQGVGGVGALRGIWSDGTTIWVAANHPEMRIYAYKMSDKSCDTGKTFASLENAGMTRQEGIWSDGVTMWVVEHGGADKAFAFNMSDKAHDQGRDIQFPSQRNFYDLWSDGATVWLVNYGETTNKLYAVTLPARNDPTATPTPTPTTTPTPTATPMPTFTPPPQNNGGNRPAPTYTPSPTATPTSTSRAKDIGDGGSRLPGPPNPDLPAATPRPTLAPPPGNLPPPPLNPTPAPTSSNNGAGAGNRATADRPRGLVDHAATPLQLYIVDGGLQCWFIGPNGSSQTGPTLSSVSALAAAHPAGAPVSLFDGQHPLTGKSVRIDYLPAPRKIRISTYYADRPPNQVDKPYVFTVDRDNTVNHLNW